MARFLYTVPPTKSQLATFGLTEDEVNLDVEVWPDNVETIECFMALSTQWKSGMNGITGLDYGSIPVVMDLNGVQHRREAFIGLQVMEREVLRLMSKYASVQGCPIKNSFSK